MSCAEGTRVRNPEGEVVRIEYLFEGAELVGRTDEGSACVTVCVIRPLAYAMKPCVKIKTDKGQELTCSLDQMLPVAGGGSVEASASLHRHVVGRDSAVEIIRVRRVGQKRVVEIDVEAPKVYEAEGLLVQV